MNALKGQLLIADPRLKGPLFGQTVVLVVAHKEGSGAFGLVLNRPTNTPLKHIWRTVSKKPCLGEALVRLGGPVAGTFLAVHTRREQANVKVTDELFVAGEPQTLEQLLESEPVLFIAGNAGWGAGQLENEIDKGIWHPFEASPAVVFADPATLYTKLRNALRRTDFFIDQLRITELPEDPSTN